MLVNVFRILSHAANSRMSMETRSYIELMTYILSVKTNLFSMMAVVDSRQKKDRKTVLNVSIEEEVLSRSLLMN